MTAEQKTDEYDLQIYHTWKIFFSHSLIGMIQFGVMAIEVAKRTLVSEQSTHCSQGHFESSKTKRHTSDVFFLSLSRGMISIVLAQIISKSIYF